MAARASPGGWPGWGDSGSGWRGGRPRFAPSGCRREARGRGRAAVEGSREMDLPMGDGGYALLARLSAGGMAGAVPRVPARAGRYRPPRRREAPSPRGEARSVDRADVPLGGLDQRPASAPQRDPVPRLRRSRRTPSPRDRVRPGLRSGRRGAALFAEGRPFPLEAAIEIGLGVLRALGHAHGLRDDGGKLVGLVHRDVSPQNVLLSLEGRSSSSTSASRR